MKKLNEILFITELPDSNKWKLSWRSPDFQVTDSDYSVEISELEAKELLLLLNKKVSHPIGNFDHLYRDIR